MFTKNKLNMTTGLSWIIVIFNIEIIKKTAFC